MRNKPSIMIQCITNQHTDSQQLLLGLTSQLSKSFPHLKINLEHSAPYWKYPDDQNLIFGIASTTRITVHDLLPHFPLTWSYTIEEQPTVEESAVWSQLNHPLEKFIADGVSWVHVYTWAEENEH